MQRMIWIVGVLLLSLPPATLAERLSYNYFEAQYVDSDLDGLGGVSAEGSGYGIEVSGELSETWHLFGRFADTDPELSGSNGDVELQRISAGVGVNSVSDSFSVFGRLTYEDINAELEEGRVNGSDTLANDNGYGLTLGGRWALNKFLELDLSAKFIDIDEVFDNDVGFSAGLLLDFSERWALRASIEKIEDFEELLFGVRAYF